MQTRLAPLTLLAGIAAAVGTVAVYQDRVGLVLGALTSLVLVLLAPAGWGTRLPYGAGYAATVALLSASRGEGDYLVTSSAAGYVVLGLALVVLVLAIGTLPRPGRTTDRQNPRPTGETPASE
jgi:hypothetical protein